MAEPQLPSFLQSELEKGLSLIRLSKTGLFKRLGVSEELEHIEDDIILHRAVLDKALIDLFSQREEIKQDVVDWLDLDNDNFIWCCERALLEPESVYTIFKLLPKILTGSRARFRPFGKKLTE